VKPTGHALVPIAAANRTEPNLCGGLTFQAAAPFLAHLIATEQGVPQTRKRRRAGRDQAIAAYTAVMQTASSE
jgi:hypothetical protein